LLLAQAELSEAQADWEKMQDGPDPDALALAEAELKAAEAKLAQLDQTQLTLDLASPIRGMVLEINFAVGERIEARQTVMTVGDIEHPSLEVYLDESDMSMAQVGARVEIVFDVLPDKMLSGVVTQVDPTLTTSWNTKSGRLLVQVDDLSILGSRGLPVGLNATVDVIGGEAANVVLVPTEALKATAEGGYEVYLLQEDGQVRSQPVTIGLMDATQVEIQSGLEAGQTVLLGDPEM
jgi:RND family efflux transporter MFP subunit